MKKSVLCRCCDARFSSPATPAPHSSGGFRARLNTARQYLIQKRSHTEVSIRRHEAGSFVEEAFFAKAAGAQFVFDFDCDRDTGWHEEHRAGLREDHGNPDARPLAILPGGPEGGVSAIEWRDMDGFELAKPISRARTRDGGTRA